MGLVESFRPVERRLRHDARLSLLLVEHGRFAEQLLELGGNHRSGNARVFVALRASTVVGYYALATAGVEKSTAPEAITKGGVPSQIPCVLLARLAVDRSEHNRGLGRGLLVDAIRRSVNVAEYAGVPALLIHARDDEARAFYEHHAEFVPSPSPLTAHGLQTPSGHLTTTKPSTAGSTHA